MDMFNPAQPYQALPPLPPSVDIENKPILKACIAARTALSELRVAGELIPNQAVLINSIPLLEAQASSEIENIVTTADKLFRHAGKAGDEADGPTKEAFRYRTALYQGFKDLRARPLSTATCVEVCRTIKGVALDIRKTPGTALENKVTGEIVYTPPEGETVLRDKLANWEKFLHEAAEIDPLVRMAVMHYQFEAIHPFTDGNGRTGRVLNILFLVEQGVLDIPVLYLSRYIIAHKADYYRLLLEVTSRGAWEEWILYMLRALKETAEWTTAKIRAIKNLHEETVQIVKNADPGLYKRELIDLIFVQPYSRIANVVDAGLAERKTASVYLKRLAEAGVLQEQKFGKEKLFVNPRFLRLLTQVGGS
jgi:Fic family protein